MVVYDRLVKKQFWHRSKVRPSGRPLPRTVNNSYDVHRCTINCKINGTTIGVYLPISNLHSILAVTNLLARDNL